MPGGDVAFASVSTVFFLQLFVILGLCGVVGWIARRWFGQPTMVGEMIAGIMLGPSLLGWVAPELRQALFPEETRSILFALSQLGIGVYMFLVGLRLRREHFSHAGPGAVAVSLSGMAVPFLAAIIITPWLTSLPILFPSHVNQLQATLFVGMAISITAFPMLARIIHERGLEGTELGTLALTAGAFDDVVAWTVLAILLATVGGSGLAPILAIGGSVAFVLFMATIGVRLLAPLGAWATRGGQVTQPILAIVILLLLFAAFLMDAIGIHAAFGGFVLGAALPKGALSEGVAKKLEPFVLVVLVPLVFAFAGFNTQLGLLLDKGLIILMLAIVLISILSKWGACWAAARLTGHDSQTAHGVGILMNARGMMEIVVLNIGLQHGIIGPALFSMFAVMAIITTLMTAPLFRHVVLKRMQPSSGDCLLPADAGTARS